MSKLWLSFSLVGSLILTGCSSTQYNAVPVVDSGTRASGAAASQPSAAKTPTPTSSDSGSVVVMVPPPSTSQPIQSSSGGDPSGPMPVGGEFQASVSPVYTPPAQDTAPVSSDVLASNRTALAADEQLDGPILAMLTTAQQQQASGDLNAASANLERAQRIAPREPQVLYRLAQVRLAQGDANQAEQLARRGLTYANGRPSLQAGLWELVAKAREQLGDPQGADLARQKARVVL